MSTSSFELERSLRRLKPGRRTSQLKRRPDQALPFVSAHPTGGPELLLDTCAYSNIREFDWLDQLLPSNRILFYRKSSET
jgi:hypothetical protein